MIFLDNENPQVVLTALEASPALTDVHVHVDSIVHILAGVDICVALTPRPPFTYVSIMKKRRADTLVHTDVCVYVYVCVCVLYSASCGLGELW